jgi:hypothetical protein
MADVRLKLQSGNQVKEAVSDADGKFQFDNLDHRLYRLTADLPGWKVGRVFEHQLTVDLGKSTCAELYLGIEELQGELHGKVATGQKHLQSVLWIEAIPLHPDKNRQPRTGSTKPDGSFLIGEIEPGDYVVAIDVEHPPLHRARAHVPIRENHSVWTQFLPRCD